VSQLPAGVNVDEDRLQWTDGADVYFRTVPADTQFPQIFRTGCRRPLSSQAQSRLNKYSLIALVAINGGSMTAARRILEIGAGLVEAGGIGVFVDNGLIAHSSNDWLELTQHRQDPQAVFFGFVNMARLRGHLVSHGMHVMGQRDGTVEHETNLDALEDFLRETCANECTWSEGETFQDERGTMFTLRNGEHPGVALPPSHPTANPFGYWKLIRKS
jgi:hypothetical protein